MTDRHYDLIVIGSGPAGQKGAINAAKMGKRVAVIERDGMVGGASVHSGTIPSKTLRHAILYLTGFNERTFYGRDYRLREHISKEEIASRVRMLVSRETQLVRAQFNRNRIAELEGIARFLDPHTAEVTTGEGTTNVRGDYVLIACGTRPARSPSIPLDGSPRRRYGPTSRSFRSATGNYGCRWGNHRPRICLHVCRPGDPGDSSALRFWTSSTGRSSKRSLTTCVNSKWSSGSEKSLLPSSLRRTAIG